VPFEGIGLGAEPCLPKNTGLEEIRMDDGNFEREDRGFGGGHSRGGFGGDDRKPARKSFGPIPVKEGDVYDVEIEGIGDKGDGIAKVQGYVIVIPNVKKGDHVKVKVNAVRGKVSFGEVVGEATAKPAAEPEAEGGSEEEPSEEADDDMGDDMDDSEEGK